MRLRSDIWIASLLRRAEAAGCFAVVIRRGSSEAGAIFIQLLGRDGMLSLYGPAPQTAYDDDQTARDSADRQFVSVLENCSGADIQLRFEQEERFDPDFWAVEIEGDAGLSLIEIATLDM